jgi:hypothetical protein
MGNKLAVAADLHLWNHRAHGGPMVGGLNLRCRQALRTLRLAVEQAEQLGCSLFAIAGDVFDGARPEPQLVRATQEALETDMGVLVVMGNHDLISDSPGDHTLGPLEPVAAIAVKPTLARCGEASVLCLPYQSGPASVWFPAELEKLIAEQGGRMGKQPRVLITHLGLAGHDAPVYLSGGHDVIDAALFGKLLFDHSIRVGLAGNWHGWRQFNFADPAFTVGVQVGALVPTGWDNPGISGYGSLIVVDLPDGGGGAVKVERHTIPGPRFVKDFEEAEAARREGCQVFLRRTVSGEEVSSARASLMGEIAAGRVQGGEIMLDDFDVRVAARTAATVARSAETLSTALDGFVQQMPLADGVDRAAVLARAKKYLGA